jgi:uncharacterized DUF497 family protein
VLIGFDPAKEARNLQKHHISLMAYALMDLDVALVTPVERHGESRIVTYAPIAGRLHQAVYTLRGSMTWMISLRKANTREVRRYARARAR